MENDQPKKADQLESQLEAMDEMDRRYFLEYTLKLTALLASSSLIKPEQAKAETGNIDAPTRFVNFCIIGGSCQLSSYLSPLAGVSQSALSNLPPSWKVPGLANSFRPSSSGVNPAIENVDYYVTPPDANPNYSQKIYHARTVVGSYLMPLIWSSTIPTGTTTGTTSMRNLINNQCAMIYGLESAPAHAIAIDMLTNPEPGSFTVGGYIHHHSTKFPAFFPAISNKIGPTVFKSPNGASAKLVKTDSNFNTNVAKQALESLIPIRDLYSGNGMSSFGSGNDEDVNFTRRGWLNQISNKMNVALQSIRDSNVAIKPGISALYELLNQAKTKIETNEFESVLNKYSIALTKYKQLTRRAGLMARNSIQGITDPTTRQSNVSITRNSLKKYEQESTLSVSGPNTAFGSADAALSEINVSNPGTAAPPEGANGFGNTNFWISYHMAHLFAFAEVALDPTKPLTNVLNLGLEGHMVGVLCKNDSVKPNNHQVDNHNIGVIPNLLWNSLFYYVLNTMLYEFIQNMKGISTTTTSSSTIGITNDHNIKSLDDPLPQPNTTNSTGALNPWRDTVIALYTEFPRNPIATGTGSDHGHEACNVTLFSGRLESGLKIYGKTKINSGYYPGAWGLHSQKMKAENRYLSLTDVGVSIANLFVRSTPHQALATLTARSKILFSLGPNGNIQFPQNIPNTSTPFLYTLEDT